MLRPKKILSALLKIFLAFLVLFLAYLVVLTGVVIWAFEAKIKKWPMFVHAAPFTLRVGDDIRNVGLIQRMKRLGYTESPDLMPRAGEWRQSGAQLRAFFTHSPLKGQGIVSGPVEINLDWKTVRSIKLMRSLDEVEQVVLEPELLDIFPAPGFEPELCRPHSPDTANPLLVDAIVLTEDPRFLYHSGIDASSIVTALKANFRAGRYVQGASTITQQLIRTVLLKPEKTLWRKVNEIFLAMVADAIYSKRTILEAYLDRVYFGQWGSLPVRGVAEASRVFFGESQSNLNPAQCALLAAMIRAPNVINPYRHPERALSRRNMVLGLLLKDGKVSREEYETSVNAPVEMRKPGAMPAGAASFLALVKERIDREAAAAPGLAGRQDVLTSLDPWLHNQARSSLKRVAKDGSAGYLILTNPETGVIRALITPTTSKWSGDGGNIETFLPLVAIPALTPEKKDQFRYTLTSPLFFPGFSGGSITFREAFYHERRLLLVRMVESLGAAKIVPVLKDYGVRAKLTADNNVAVEPISPTQMAQVYGLLATLGDARSLQPGVRILDGVTPDPAPKPKAVTLNTAVTFLVNHLLKDAKSIALADGKADMSWAKPSIFIASDAAGSWGIAFRRDALLLVRTPGEDFSAAKFKEMVALLLPPLDSHPEAQIPPPEGIVVRKICVESGLRATSLCRRVISEPFLKGSQPVEWCPLRH